MIRSRPSPACLSLSGRSDHCSCTRRSSSSSTSRSTGKLQARCREPPPFYIGSTRSVGTIGRRSSCCARLSSPAWSRSSRRRTPFCVLWWLVCSCYAVGLAVAKPYKRIEDDVLAVATNLVLLLVFLGASWITLFDAIDEEAPGKADDRISDSISQRNFRIFESSLRLEPSPRSWTLPLHLTNRRATHRREQ